MPVDPTALDTLLAARGGFEKCYKKLLAAAKVWLAIYGGNKAGRLAVRQLDAEELVNIAFERAFTEEFEPGTDLYLLLRRHMQNHVHSLAKSTGEAKTIRADSSTVAKERYLEQDDPTAPGVADRVLVTDDTEFCNQVLLRVCANAKDDPEVDRLAMAIIEGFYEPDELRVVTDLSPSQYTAAFKRLRRRFMNEIATIKEDPR